MAVDLSEALLEQSRMLLAADRTKPKQVNLRRSVSAAYYAVFHLLVGEATDRVVGVLPGPDRDRLRAQVSRWYGHDHMKRVAGWFGPTATPPKEVAELLGYPRPGTVPARLSLLADTFVKLQEARHDADYDLTYVPRRVDVVLLVERAALAFDDAAELSGDSTYCLFLAMLLTGEKVIRTR
jgi:hypothetical protein